MDSMSATDSSIHHLRAEEYSYRVPTPPRIIVPPPSINAAVAPPWTLKAPSNHPVLRNISYDSMKTSSLLDWSYERRREAQAVLPFLYLGPLNAAKDRAFLQREGITMVLAIRQQHGFESRIMSAALRVARELNLDHATIEITTDRELIAAFPSICQKINNHLIHIDQLHHQESRSGISPSIPKVLVFCESGNERSAAAVAAYLMEVHEDVDYIRAMQLCQSQRFCVNFDDTIKRILQSYWDILKARRDVSQQKLLLEQETGGIAPLSKRALSRDDDEEEDMEMGDDEEEDAERFERRAFAPFVDMDNP